MIAIEFLGPAAPTVAVGDTVRLTAQALDRGGQPVPEAPVRWYVLEPEPFSAFTIDSLTGLVTGAAPGTGRAQARVETLRTDPITVTVVEPPDGEDT